MGRRWEDIKRARVSAAPDDEQEAFRAGYKRARLAFELGEQIRSARERRGMTQAELASKVRTSQPAVARLEAGGVEPRIETLERIGYALGIDLIVRFEEPASRSR
jgi:HTH-type transcriptional regulator/antitoxin HipB